MFTDFHRFFKPTSLPTCLPKSIKINEKSIPRCLPMLASSFNWFSMNFYSQLRPPESQKSSPRCSERIFQIIAFRNWHRCLIDFGAILAPCCHPKSTKFHLNIDAKRHQKNDWFLDGSVGCLGLILEAKLEPCWPHFAAQDRPRAFPFKSLPRRLQDASKSSPRRR